MKVFPSSFRVCRSRYSQAKDASYDVHKTLRNTPSTAGNPMTGSERPSPEPLLKQEASPAVLGGEIILEMLWSLQMP